MAKNSVLDYDNVPDNNTDMGGIGIQGTSAVNNFDNAFRTLMSQLAKWTDGNTIASGTTTDLSTVQGMYVSVSGTSTITSFGTAKAGWMKYLRFTGVATITYNATSMILPGAASITTTAGATAIFVSEGSGNWRCLFYSPSVPAPVAGYISPGFNLANNATDPINDIDFPAGVVASSNASPIIMPHTAATMRLDIAWGVGDGGRFDAAISDNWWHCFIISNGTLVSRGFSASLDPTTQPNYPAGFTHYRRVATFPRIGGTLVAMKQREDHFDYATPIVDRNSTAAQASTLLGLAVPPGLIVQPKFTIVQQQGAAGHVQTQVANAGDAPESTVITTAAGELSAATITGGIFSNTSSQIQFLVAILSGSIASNSFKTKGWIDTRGRA